MKNIYQIGIVAATLLLSSTAAAEDIITQTTIESQHIQAVPMLLPAGKSHFSVSGIGPMSCVVFQPDIDSLADHKFKARVLAGQLASEKCLFDVRTLHPTFIVLMLESDEIVEGVERVFDVRITH